MTLHLFYLVYCSYTIYHIFEEDSLDTLAIYDRKSPNEVNHGFFREFI